LAGAGTELVIRPVNPLNGVSPGQSAVLYLGTRVLGQCTIDRTVSAVPAWLLPPLPLLPTQEVPLLIQEGM
jgi:hypothetical protein